MSLGPPSLLTSARNRETSVCSLNTLAMSSLMTCRRKGICLYGNKAVIEMLRKEYDAVMTDTPTLSAPLSEP